MFVNFDWICPVSCCYHNWLWCTCMYNRKIVYFLEAVDPFTITIPTPLNFVVMYKMNANCTANPVKLFCVRITSTCTCTCNSALCFQQYMHIHVHVRMYYFSVLCVCVVYVVLCVYMYLHVGECIAHIHVCTMYIHVCVCMWVRCA